VGIVRTLSGVRPSPRFDTVVWTVAKIEESESSTGPWSQIDTITLSPVDTDPENPAPRNLTTSSATKEPGWYRVRFEDAFGSWEYSEPIGSPGAPVPFTINDWLRRLLEDAPRVEQDSAAADGVQVDFYVSNPPITGDVAVLVDTAAVDPSLYAAIDTRGVHFFTAPTEGSTVTVQYLTQTWPDGELAHYIEQGRADWNTDRDVVYQAAIYAIDSLLLGMAASLEFGAGAEQFNLPGVYQRLMELRAMFAEVLVQSSDQPSLEVIRITFPSRDPSWPGGFYGSPFDDSDIGQV
jgi:hypothetical protein